MAGNNEDNTVLNLAHTIGSIFRDIARTISGQVVKTQVVTLDVTGGDTTESLLSHENPLPTLPSAHMFSKGNIPGHESLRKSGGYSAIPTTERLLDGAGTLIQPYLPISAVTIEAISTSANDAAAGSGAQTIVIEGLDANFNRQSDTITMNGTSATTATTNTYIRVFNAYIATVGTYAGSNAGNITIRANGAGSTFTTIMAGIGRCTIAHYCVPAGMKYFINEIHLIVDASQASEVHFYKLENADDVVTPYTGKIMVHDYHGVKGGYDFSYDPPIYIHEKTDIWVAGVSAAATAAISAEINGILETV